MISGKVEHECSAERGLGYWIEALLMLLPFAKEDSEITLKGVTNANLDLSVDTVRAVTKRVVERFGVDIDLKVSKRGVLPLGGGEVIISCKSVKELSTVVWTDQGRFKKIRGVSFSCKVAPTICARMIDSARGVFNNLLPDVKIYSDATKGKLSGLSPGFGCALAIESTTDTVLSAELVAEGPSDPDELGLSAAKLLLEEVSMGGCVDSLHQSIVLLYMILTPEDISKVKFGKLTEQSVRFLRTLREFFGIIFKIVALEEENAVVLSCRGIGFKNFARANC